MKATRLLHDLGQSLWLDNITRDLLDSGTLLFSREHYLAAADAYLRGIERRIDAGLNPYVGSVASVFISRWDAAAAEPHNLAKGWVKFDFEAAFSCPVKMINDAAMQALGSYRRGTMLFLGTGLGSAMVVEGTVVPMELGHLAIGKRTFEDDLGARGLKRLGRKKWQKRVEEVTERFVSALHLDDVVLGGGNAEKLTRVPAGCRVGDNAWAFLGGFRLWEKKAEQS